MDALVLTIGALGTLATFLWGIYLVVKKDHEAQRVKVIKQVDDCVIETTATKEAIKRLQLRIDNVEGDVSKLETAVEKMGDKLETKLDKIMDFLMEQRG